MQNTYNPYKGKRPPPSPNPPKPDRLKEWQGVIRKLFGPCEET